jgi:hypothetical protein
VAAPAGPAHMNGSTKTRIGTMRRIDFPIGSERGRRA